MKKLLTCVLIMWVITLCWIGLCYILDGKVTPQRSDAIVLLALAYFINKLLYDKNILKQ